jgi:hypothetical protein
MPEEPPARAITDRLDGGPVLLGRRRIEQRQRVKDSIDSRLLLQFGPGAGGRLDHELVTRPRGENRALLLIGKPVVTGDLLRVTERSGRIDQRIDKGELAVTLPLRNGPKGSRKNSLLVSILPPRSNEERPGGTGRPGAAEVIWN